MQTFNWYWNRLRRMSAPEIGHRCWVAVRGKAERHGLFTAARVPEPVAGRASLLWLPPAPRVEPAPYVQAAKEIRDGRCKVFQRRITDLGQRDSWNRDAKTGIVAPLQFSRQLDYRDARLVGDIKYLWEPNRHLDLVVLGQAYALTRDRKYLDAVALQLQSWFSQSPYLYGPNWTSALEAAIRIINWSLLWCLTGGESGELFSRPEGQALRRRWLASVYQHLHFIASNFSRYSSANNHLIGEAAGLFIGATTWGLWHNAKPWAAKCKRILEQEIQRQVTIDGVSKEQAIGYQQFVLDFFLMSGLAARAAGTDFSWSYWNKIEKMIDFIESLMDVRGRLPMIGDDDDGLVIRLSPHQHHCPFRSLLATGAVIFERDDFMERAGILDDKTRWLLGDDAATRHANKATKARRIKPRRRSFPTGGYYILGKDLGKGTEIRMVVDAGPLGYQSIAAHGHADALSVTLSVQGNEILVDPGTYAYHTQRRWREYFRGTRAHNTVVVDGADQSVSGGNFMWIRHASARCLLWKVSRERDEFIGEHDGYMRLPDPARHQRTVFFVRDQSRFLIMDRIDAKAEHVVERYWHFAEDCQVTVDGLEILVATNGVQVRLRCLDGHCEALRLRGSDDPIGGWVSRRFDVKVPSTTVVWKNRIRNATELRTEICVNQE